jgi:hypothetical protein
MARNWTRISHSLHTNAKPIVAVHDTGESVIYCHRGMAPISALSVPRQWTKIAGHVWEKAIQGIRDLKLLKRERLVKSPGRIQTEIQIASPCFGAWLARAII